ANPRHAIVRTAWLFGAGGKNFVDTMLALGAQREEVSVVTDQVGCPTWTGHLAGALVALAERPDATGIYHVAGAGSCSWNELASEVFRRAGLDCRVLPATSEQFVRPAKRPAYSVLGSERADAVSLAPWQDGVAEYLATRVTA
ncbi:MAG TPA: sugar nucleotide-binding protein, partial [Solirubrobacteraceae bacterium]